MRHLTAALKTLRAHYPRASVIYAQLLAELMADDHGEMALPDLSEAVGCGRDSSAVQKATERLAAAGLVTRELMAGDPTGGRFWFIRLAT